MNFRYIMLILLAVIFTGGLYATEQKKRPKELQFYVNSQLNTTTVIGYNQRGDVVKMSSYENGKLTDYARYTYGNAGRLLFERTYDPYGILLKTRNYCYNETGFITGEKVYSASNVLIEYLAISYSGKKIIKIEYYKAGGNLYQTIEFNYRNDRLTAMVYNKIGKYLMVIKAVYNSDMLLIGHDIKHSNADVKIETKYIYEDGNITENALNLIFR